MTTYRRHIINLELRDYWTIQRLPGKGAWVTKVSHLP